MLIDRIREMSNSTSASTSEMIRSTSSLRRIACLSVHVAHARQRQPYNYRFKPNVMKRYLIDEITRVKDEEAIEMARQLARKEGLLVGFSSAPTTFTAPKVARRAESNLLVFVLPDTGERYLSTSLFQA